MKNYKHKWHFWKVVYAFFPIEKDRAYFICEYCGETKNIEVKR